MSTFPSQVPSGVSIIPFGSGNQNIGSTSNYLQTIYVNNVYSTSGGGGGVAGPASTTNSGISIWNSTGGTTLADSQFTVDAGNLLPKTSGTQNIGSVTNPVYELWVSGINTCVQVPSAWCCWDATSGSPVISGSLNVASLTDGGVGSATLNFSTAMPDTRYAAVGNARGNGTTTICSPFLIMTTGVKFVTRSNSGNVDAKINTGAVWSNK